MNSRELLIENEKLKRQLGEALEQLTAANRALGEARKQEPVGYVVIVQGISYYKTTKDEAERLANCLDLPDNKEPVIRPVYIDPVPAPYFAEAHAALEDFFAKIGGPDTDAWHDYPADQVFIDGFVYGRATAAPVSGQQSLRGTNEYGLDIGYMSKKLNILLRDLDRHTPDEAARVLARLAKVAKEGVLAEAEFAPHSPVLPDGYMLVRADVIDFLNGSGELIGCGFGDKPDGERGTYWWRRFLPDVNAKLIAAQQSPAVAVPELVIEVLRQAIMVVAYRAGDVDTEDGSYATTDTDSIIRLESALCEALGTKYDDLDLAEAIELLGKLSPSHRITEQDAGEVEGSEVYLFRRKGLEPFLKCSRERFDELSVNDAFETKILYENALVSAPFPHPRISDV